MGKATVGVAVLVGVGVSVATCRVGAKSGEIMVVGIALGWGTRMAATVGVPLASGCGDVSPMIAVGVPSAVAVSAGVGVIVGVGVSGIGMTERGSVPGGITITPGVPAMGGVTTMIP